ncbi:hypothetical protein KUTeg_005860 [Tegillarca granosa]|uniref:Transposase n=1 Tax=Tegillarca granosa TaxID=220873 RepID=A0ABQ9FH09_TEGGR|nr:hypothetical protein KUTeg_005860 [Tegillarca granosa]
MAKEHPEVTHWFDCWHVAKGIYKKLEAAGKRRSCKNLSDWARSISNHLYWCAASSEGDGDLVHDKWISILNHVTNIQEGHEGKYQSCQHGQLANRKWIKRDSKAFLELEKVVKGRLLVKDVKNKSPAEQTSGLEAFHRVVCHFAPKLVHFFHAQMEARLYLAALHFNKNGARPQAVSQDGTPMFAISYPKSRKGEGVAKEVKVKQTYGKQFSKMSSKLC